MRRLTAIWPLAMVIGACSACGITRADALADRLAPHVGETLDLVEIGSGRRLVRPTLEQVVAKNGTVTALRLRPEGETRATSFPVAGIARIVAGRETIHEAEVKQRGASQLKTRRAKEAYDRAAAASRERMEANGVQPWPPLTAEQHAAEERELEAYVAEVQKLFPRLKLTRTHEFLVATDIPPDQMAPYVAGLDRMHDVLCDLYGIPRGESVWRGKCLVIAFLDEADFCAYEQRFQDLDAKGVHGLCHQRSDGRVITACHRGGDAPAFAHMLVHETSHGFNHRWLSPERLPSWLNEGLAEWVGATVVTTSDQVPLKEAAALQLMRSRGDLGPQFFDRHPLDTVQYGIASGLVRFLVKRDPGKFTAFVRGIKEGMPAGTSLEKAYGGSLDELVKAYGASIGIPTLHP
ncbi:MAG: hypothetical protein ACKOC8_12670 [Pirellulales bacterium]